MYPYLRAGVAHVGADAAPHLDGPLGQRETGVELAGVRLSPEVLPRHTFCQDVICDFSGSLKAFTFNIWKVVYVVVACDEKKIEPVSRSSLF